MFRISRYIRTLVDPAPPRPAAGAPPGPVVIWNLIRRCNLTCKHCYSTSANTDFAGELSTAEVFQVMDDLHRYGVPVLILSGGEPLMRPDIFEISERAKRMGFYVGLSTNGTLIDEHNIDRIAAVGYDYVGISLDGLGETHDRFRRRDGAFAEALAAVRLCHSRGIKVGLRFTLTRDNAQDLPGILELMEREQVDKFYLSHLNYAGRGNRNRADDALFSATRTALERLFEISLEDALQGRHREFVTGNNDADAVLLLRWAQRRFPERAELLADRLRQWGGNASGLNIGNIDNLGNVHPDTFWWHHTLGNVRERPFSAIWDDTSDPILAGLKQQPRPVKGRCGDCHYLDICGGNTRVRAEQLTGDPWEEDPGCYLQDEEVGATPGPRRVTNRPFRRIKVVSAS